MRKSVILDSRSWRLLVCLLFRGKQRELNVIGGYFSRGLDELFINYLVKPVSVIPVVNTRFIIRMDCAATSIKSLIYFLEIEHDQLSLYCFCINYRLSLFLDSSRCQSLPKNYQYKLKS